jgi:hypothetical protein
MNVRKQPIKWWFYFDMVRSLGSAEDREDAIVGVPETRIVCILRDVKLDLASREKEFEALHFPCEKLFDTFDWQNGYLNIGNSILRKPNSSCAFRARFCSVSSQIPVTKLKKAVKKEAVCHVFEKVNADGVVLSDFELLTATYAAENFRLRGDWYRSLEWKVAGVQPASAIALCLSRLLTLSPGSEPS